MFRWRERIIALAIVATIVASVFSFALPGHGVRTPEPTSPTWSNPTPKHAFKRMLSIGDSIAHGSDGSASASYRKELTRLLNAAGQPHEWRMETMPGTTCAHWADRIYDVLTEHQPNVLFINCGTNDTPNSSTSADYWRILIAAQNRGVVVAAAVIGPPDMLADPTNTSRPYILDWMRDTKDEIRQTLTSFPQVHAAEMGRVPTDGNWMQMDGIHPNWWGEKAYAHIFYEALKTVMGWKPFQIMCGLSGFWPGETRPIPDVDYIPCRNY